MNESQETQPKPEAGLPLGAAPLLACCFCGNKPTASHGKVRCQNALCKIQPKTAVWFVKTSDAIVEWNAAMQRANDQAQRPPGGDR